MQTITHSSGLYVQVVDHLQAQGHLLTRQRQVLLEAICAEKRIPDMEAFWIALRYSHPISWATVHGNVRLLLRYGIVQRRKNTQGTYEYLMREDFVSESQHTNNK